MQRLIYLAFLLLTFYAEVIPAFGQASASTGDAAQKSSKPDLLLQGNVRGDENHTYVEVPFEVPANLQRVTITFAYTEKDQRTWLDLGLLDPAEVRCWSGGNKSTLTVGISDATPSCMPGPIAPGRWRVLIGVPNIRPLITSHYTIQVFFTRTGLIADEPTLLREPLRSGPAWYRGDLHMHTGHSDGQCPSQTGKMVPCPVFFTVDAAARRGLDFIAITDHNATSHYDAMRELQPYFDKLLLILGREITTFQGHFNLFGTTQFLDFRLGSKEVPQINDLLQRARSLGALASINHPASPSGETCFGCGWTTSVPTDMNLVNAIEIANGGSGDHVLPGIQFWEHQLDLGYRLTAVGGSDNHRPLQPLDKQGSIGRPTTVVYAENLSTPAILAGIHAGHVCIDLAGTSDRVLELTATGGTSTAQMGDTLTAPPGMSVAFAAKVSSSTPGKVVLLEDGKPLDIDATKIEGQYQTAHGSWTSDGQRHWFRAEVVEADQKLLLLGNPIYLNWENAH
jgi:hypothetical protein